MATYREIVYMAQEKLKSVANDSFFNIEHFMFLAEKVRALLLERKYRDVRKGEVSRANYQDLEFELIEVPAIPNTDCYGSYLRTKMKMPSTLKVGEKHVYPYDYFSSENFTYVPMERMPYVGHNRWLKNTVYMTKGPDDYLYLKTSNPQAFYLKKIHVDAVWQSVKETYNYITEYTGVNCDILDVEFPMEETLVQPLIQMIVEDIAGVKAIPEDKFNNGTDDIQNSPDVEHRERQ